MKRYILKIINHGVLVFLFYTSDFEFTLFTRDQAFAKTLSLNYNKHTLALNYHGVDFYYYLFHLSKTLQVFTLFMRVCVCVCTHAFFYLGMCVLSV